MPVPCPWVFVALFTNSRPVAWLCVFHPSSEGGGVRVVGVELGSVVL